MFKAGGLFGTSWRLVVLGERAHPRSGEETSPSMNLRATRRFSGISALRGRTRTSTARAVRNLSLVLPH